MNFPSLPMLLYSLILLCAFVSAMELEKRVTLLPIFGMSELTDELEKLSKFGMSELTDDQIKEQDKKMFQSWMNELTDYEIEKLSKYSKSRELYFDQFRGTRMMFYGRLYFYYNPYVSFPFGLSTCADLDYVTRKERCAKRSIKFDEKDFNQVLCDTYQGIDNNWKAYNILIIQSAGKFTKKEGVFPEKMEVNEDGAYLEGAGVNAAKIQTFLFGKCPLLQSNGNLATHNFSIATEEDPRAVIDNFFNSCKTKSLLPFIYYTGHGSADGSWCFTVYGKDKHKQVGISPSYISDRLKMFELSHMLVISQSCFSGKWLEQENIIGYTSATGDTCSKSTPNGSFFTLWVCGKGTKPTNPVPQTKGDNTFNRLHRKWKNYI